MVVIEVQNIGKKYKISRQNGKYLVLRDVLQNSLLHPIKLFTGINRINEETFWALQDIIFNIEEGEILGIIGRNGAGKSTLLKILARITPPTIGRIEIRGKSASLLEVGTGFHPELTGRENIYINGAILGMRKSEIKSSFDEIVEFSEVKKFLDIPIKYFSSGMAMRLAFSVAAHLRSDILLIDEVLAVGDLEFQKKCLSKIDEVTRKKGKTVVFVSHNLEAIKKLCHNCLYLEMGKMAFLGNTLEAIAHYDISKKERNSINQKELNKNNIKIECLLKDSQNGLWELNKYLVVKVSWEKCSSKNLECDLAFYTSSGLKLFAIESRKFINNEKKTYPDGVIFHIKNIGLAVDEVRVDIGIKESGDFVYKFLLEDYARIAIDKKKLSIFCGGDILVAPEVCCESI